MHPADMTPALSGALKATATAGWELPLVVPSTFPSTREAFDVNEANGTRIAIVGSEADARLVVAALSYVIGSP